MLQNFYHSFRTRLIVAIGIILFSVLSAYFLFFIQRLTAVLHDGLVSQGENLVRNIGYASELGVLAGDPTFVDASISGVLDQPDVVFVGVYNKKGDTIAAKEKIAGISQMFTPAPVNRSLTDDITYQGVAYLRFMAPITIRTNGIPETGDPIGASQIILSLDRVSTQQRRTALLYGAVSVIIFLGAGAAAIYFTRRMTRSIDKLLIGVRSISAEQFTQRVEVETRDEFGRLADAFNHMAQNLLDAHKRDQEISRLKSEFLSIAAHQLRTPLTGIKWMLDMFLHDDAGKITAKQRTLLRQGFDTNNRMIGLVNDLLNVVQIEEGRFGYSFVMASPEKVLAQSIEDIRMLAGQRHIQIALQHSSAPLPFAYIDPKKISLVFANILENAVSYTPAGGSVRIQSDARGNTIFISIEDTGIGIPREQFRYLFNKFFRAPNAVTTKPNGSGLGLFIAKNIVEKHGGSIRIESEEGKGTRVFLTLPIAA